MNLYIRNCIKSNLKGLLRFSSTSVVPDATESLEVLPDEDLQQREEEIQLKRNKSRLSENHFNLVNGRIPYPNPKITAHLTVKYHRKLYGKYGASSGVNPNICWPSQNDISERQEYESVAYPFTIPEMMARVAEQKQIKAAQIKSREEDIAAKLQKLDQWKRELKERIEKKTNEATAAKEKKERLIEEVRRYFGFKLDPKDERFQEMLTKREKEQKKQEKEARREAKEKRMLIKLQQTNAELDKK